MDSKRENTFGWETKEEKILRGMKISPVKKMEGLRLFNEMMDAASTKQQKILRKKLREQK